MKKAQLKWKRAYGIQFEIQRDLRECDAEMKRDNFIGLVC